MGEIEKSGFHFLGIEYPPTQIEDNTSSLPKTHVQVGNSGQIRWLHPIGDRCNNLSRDFVSHVATNIK